MDAEIAEGLPETVEEPAEPRLRVVIATADDVWRPVVEAWMLERVDLQVVKVRSVLELLDLEDLDRLHLVVLDHHLPGIDGLVAGAMLREINPAARLVLATADPFPTLRQLAEEIGFWDVMEKTEDGFGLHRAARL